MTDHDHTGGISEARAEADRLGLRLINGVEISVTWRGRTIHVVGLDFDEQDENLQNLLADVRKGRLKRLEAIAAKLEKKGIGGAYDGALALAANKEMVSRTHVAEFLIKNGHVKNKRQAFTKYLGDGKSCAVRHEWATLADCVSAVNGAGGAGIEVHSGNCCKNDRLNYALLADRFGLLASAGSDFHRLDDFSGGILGACPDLPENCKPVRAHFSRH